MEDRAIVALYALDRYDAMHAEKRGRRPASCCSSGYRSIFDTMPGQNAHVR